MIMKKISLISAFLLVFVTMQAQDSWYFSRVINAGFEEVTERTKAALKSQGFGIVTEIDMDKTLKEKLDHVEMNSYKILGACNPAYAYATLKSEENIGLFLPCKVLVKALDDGTTEVVMVNPEALMKMLGNDELLEIAADVTDKFRKALSEI